ncbi:MAG: M13 family metallopeptidase [Ferruginibacter sp.]|nr:M13 family metallopeptidase [Ferruginibacter sp.]
MQKSLLFLLLSVSFFSCHINSKTTGKQNNKPDFLASNIDSTVSPGDDFFSYANGAWIKNNPIPNEQSSWGIGNLVVEENLKRLRSISEASAKNNAVKGSNDQKIGDFWSVAMDTVKLEKEGLQPIQPLLSRIDAISDIKSLIATVAELKKIGSSTLFSDYVSQDPKNSETMAYLLWQGGIALPEREYYFKNDSTTILIREQYKKYITTLLVLSGEKEAKASEEAKNILILETKLAEASRKIEDLRDPYLNYNKLKTSELNSLSDNIDWSIYLNTIGVTKTDSVIVGQPDFFKALNVQLKSTPLTVWKSYLKFNLLSDYSGVLPDAFGKEAFAFSKLFSGAKIRKPRWKRVIQMEEEVMGEMLGQLYVKEFFNEKAKKRYSKMVEAIRDALKERISQINWMSDSTKKKAHAKLAAIKSKVGYPDKWKDFSSMDIGKESLAKNYMNSCLWWHNYQYSKLDKPVNRDEWDMTPQTYNAYYNPSNNEIVLPAGIFTVPGYRDEELDDALVYGYAGASTIGHEITHGFDDEGRQYDENGNLKSWWTAADEEAFKKRAEVMIKQFDEYEPVKGYHINGKATLGENIADLGGILLGLDAFKKTKQFKNGKKIGNIEPMKRYFLGYSLGWLGHIREEQLKNRLLTDVHSPAKYRVNGPFADVDEFYNTFDIKPGSSMYREESIRVRIW